MKIPTPVVDYRKFRLSKLNTPEYRHMNLLFFWPIFGILFWAVETVYKPGTYFPMHCVLDDMIPFNEIFVIPYVFWFAYLVLMHLYTLFYDLESFYKLISFIIITYTVTLLIYLIFPTCQNLRPTEFARDNALTRFMQSFYEFDTKTNVCPSIHVIGSFAVMFTAWHSKRIKSIAIKATFAVVTLLICVSTVFLKQHSVLDMAWALPLCGMAYYFCFIKKYKKHKRVKKECLTA